MYEEFYNLTGKPFQLTPDLRFLYPSTGHKRALSYLHYGLEQGEGFVVISGNIGTGKTLLIQALLAELAGEEIATARVAAANLDADNVMPMVAAALGQPYEGLSKVALMQRLEKSLLHARDYLKGVILIVDEAQTLAPEALEELRILSNLEANGQALLQVFLVGQTELRKTLKDSRMEQLRQRVVASYHLEALSLDEAKRYVGFRLVAVGWNGAPSFDSDLYKVVHEWTGGIPRKINMLMDRLLVYGYLEEIKDFTADHVKTVAEEMSSELAGDLANRPPPPGESAEPKEDAEAASGKEAKRSSASKQAHRPRKKADEPEAMTQELEARLMALEDRLDRLAVNASDES